MIYMDVDEELNKKCRVEINASERRSFLVRQGQSRLRRKMLSCEARRATAMVKSTAPVKSLSSPAAMLLESAATEMSNDTCVLIFMNPKLKKGWGGWRVGAVRSGWDCRGAGET